VNARPVEVRTAAFPSAPGLKALYATLVSSTLRYSATVGTVVVCVVSIVAGIAGCSRPAPPPPEKAPDAPGLGEVMVTVGRRFETAGRAALANRWELAGFEAGELGELFESDVPHAQLPKEGPTAQIPAMAKAFLESAPPDLENAAKAKDSAKFTAAFAHAAALCNACHASAEKAFIEVPSVPGQSVPILDPVAAQGPRAAPAPSPHTAN
jgi:hypothetical protein